MSQVLSLHSLQAAIAKANDFLGPSRVWKANNPLQTAFQHYVQRGLNGPDIESIASLNVEEVNRFLRERGFDIRLSSFAPNEFGTAAVLDVLASWNIAGIRTAITYLGKIYPAVELSECIEIRHFGNRFEDHPVIGCITTDTGDLVYLTPQEDRLSWVDMLEHVWALQTGSHRGSYADSLVFPMVDMKVTTDVSWMVGYHTTDLAGQTVRVAQALQQNKLRLNELGVRAQSGSAMRLEVLGGREGLIIDQPFLLWMTKSQRDLPYFVAHITPEDWRDPGDLKNL